jgi:hypothetical protein
MLTDESAESAGLFTALMDRFAVLGGIDLEPPDRTEAARSADFTGWEADHRV